VNRFFDIFGSFWLLFFLSPLIVCLSLSVRIFLGRPVFFRQQRPGLGGKPFLFVKFRTMSNKTDSEGVLLPDEERLVALGRFLRKTSLDELPSLLNVLLGDMSLVGPRPLLMRYLPRYSERQFRRHEVKPGITGWAQINGRNAISWREKFELDVWYVDHRSFFLDVKILLLTVPRSLFQRGISAEDHATMPEFYGNNVSESSFPLLSEENTD